MSRFVDPTILALAALLLAPAAASAAETEPGEEWEQTTQMEMKGLPFAMPATTWKFCKPLGDWNDPPAARKDSDCKTTEVKRDGNTMRWKVVCTGKEKMEGEGEMTFAGQSYTGSMQMHMAQGDMSMKMSGKRLGKPCDAAKVKRDVAALQQKAEQQQQQGQALTCQNAVDTMAAAAFTGEPPLCRDAVKRDELCARARTPAGFAQLKQRTYDNALEVATRLCKLDVKRIEAGLCDDALKAKDVGYLGPHCPEQSKVLAKAECAGRSYSGVTAGYRDFCTKYAADELVKEEAKQKGKDAAAEKGKKLLKGVLGF